MRASNASLDLRKRFSYDIRMAMASGGGSAVSSSHRYSLRDAQQKTRIFKLHFFNDWVMLLKQRKQNFVHRSFYAPSEYIPDFAVHLVWKIPIILIILKRRQNIRPIIQFSHLKRILVTLMQQTNVQLSNYSHYLVEKKNSITHVNPPVQALILTMMLTYRALIVRLGECVSMHSFGVFYNIIIAYNIIFDPKIGYSAPEFIGRELCGLSRIKAETRTC